MSGGFKYTSTTIFLICLNQICFYTQRHEFAILFATYAVFFGVYLGVLAKVKSRVDFVFFLKVGILMRFMAVFSFPNLSDDIYRFLWDGHLINLGENPFNHPPQYYFENHLFTDRLTPELFSKLNSPNYYSVYPTVCQVVFQIATFLFPKSLYGAAVVIKLFLFACEYGTIVLLKKMLSDDAYFGIRSLINYLEPYLQGPKAHFMEQAEAQHGYYQPLIYALNPLIIIELVGNAHFEAAMIFFFILAVYILEKGFEIMAQSSWGAPFPIKKLVSSATVFALSIVSKMLPLMFLPLFFKELKWKRSFYYWGIVGLFTLILSLPIYSSLFVNNIGESLSLYFKKFEFNASIFYAIKAIGFYLYGYNIIQQTAPFLTGFVILIILIKSFFLKNTASAFPKSFFEDSLLVVSVYLACATTVHPWYAALPLACSVFTRWRFPMVWTFFILLTYSGYTEGSSKHTENIIYLIIEYSAVYAFFIFEYFLKTKKYKII